MWIDYKKNFCPCKYFTSKNCFISLCIKATVKRTTTTWNLFCKIVGKLVEKWCCTFYYPRMKPPLQQIRFKQVAKKLLQKLQRSSTFCIKSVNVARLLPTQGKLVLQKVTELMCMASLPRNFIQSGVSIYATCNTESYLLQDRFDLWAIKRVASLSDSFCSNLLPVLLYL